MRTTTRHFFRLQNISFNRHELAGSFGDIGTDLPLILAVIASANLDFTSVFCVFGVLQILSGVLYGLPMPMQPLKAMAVIVISQKVSGSVLYGAGLAIGVVMLVLTFSGLLKWFHDHVPHHVVRGLQMGLGLSLSSLALKSYIPENGAMGYVIAILGFILYALFQNSRKIPASLVLIALGIFVSLILGYKKIYSSIEIGFYLPEFNIPSINDIWTGFLVLAIPQLPLSLSNSVVATHKTLSDFYPDHKVSIRKLGVTYGVANMLAPFLSGIPVCHGCGGLAGHHAFGGRTGGSVILYGSMYVIIGLLFPKTGMVLFEVFPRSLLGVILLIEALVLMRLVKDVVHDKDMFFTCLLIAVISVALPHGFFIGMVVGIFLSYIQCKE